MDDYIGHIIMFGSNFTIRGYSTCQGQLLAINSNTALFSLLGTTFGGDGRTTFGLPDFRGRTPIGMGHGPGLQSYGWGERGGIEHVTLNQTQMPSHNHIIVANPSGQKAHVQLSATSAVRSVPVAGDVPAAANFSNATPIATPVNNFGPPTDPVQGQEIPSVAPSSLTMGMSGGNLSHINMQPFLAVSFQICMYGIYPSRS